jgi:uncharacterized protein (TIGR03437 family)
VSTGTIITAQSATITASLNGLKVSTNLSLALTAQPSALTCSPGTVNAPGSSTCTVTLSAAAPAGGAPVTLSSDNANMSVPASVLIGAGQTMGSFVATAAVVSTDQTVQIAATFNGASTKFVLAVSAPAQLSALVCAPSTLAGNASGACTISLTKPTAAALTILVSSNKASLLVPANVTIGAGSASATFTVSTSTISSNDQATVTATVGAQMETAKINLATVSQLSTLSCAMAVMGNNASTACTVGLTAASSSTETIALSASSNFLTLPASVTIPGGQATGNFPISTALFSGGNLRVTVTASLNGQSVTTQIMLNSPVQLSGLTCSPTIISALQPATCTVSLTGPAQSGDYNVALSSDNSSVTVPASVLIPAGSQSSTFAAVESTASGTGAVILTASAGGNSVTASLSLGGSAKLTSLSCASAKVPSGSSLNCAVELVQAASNPFTIAINTNNPIVTAPPSVLASVGQTEVSFQLNAGVSASQQAVTISAGAGNSVQAVISVLPGDPPVITAPAQISASPLTPVQFTAMATDEYGLALTLSASGLPAGASFDPHGGSFQWTPSADQTGTFALTLTVSDSAGLSSSQNVAITVDGRKASVLGLYNAASYTQDQTCSAGSLATLTGTGFKSSGLEQANGFPWPTQLGGVQVILNGANAPILAVTESLIQFQCPMLPAGTQISLTVQPATGEPSDPFQFVLKEATPGLFSLGGTNQGAVLIAGTEEIAMSATSGLPSRPARKGEYLSIYANGLGPLTETAPQGAPAPFDRTIATTDQVVVEISGVDLRPSFAGLAPGLAGVYQVNVQLPQDVASGDSVPVLVKVILGDGTTLKSNTVTIAIQ